jgi:hypothetical protein
LKRWIEKQVNGLTTASVVKLWQGPNEERKAIIANAGDSRVSETRARSNDHLKLVAARFSAAFRESKRFMAMPTLYTCTKCGWHEVTIGK